jgi:DNA-binding CsgD family transcriptional regulator
MSTKLVGREAECRTIDRSLDAGRSGRGSVLVLRGDPGIGKTALLDGTVEVATGFRVLRTVGVESESELAYSALQLFCRPVLDRLDDLPPPQRAALEVAFGLSMGVTPEPFLVGLGALTLIAMAAEQQPLLCIIDDAHWLDRLSARTLGFVARRLMAEPVTLLFATRPALPDLAGLPELIVDGLGPDDAERLLNQGFRGPMDARVRQRIVADSQGNPLALLELAHGMSAGELAVGLSVPTELPLSGRIELSFRRRIEELPDATRRLLLLAAADELGGADTLWRAANLLEIDADAMIPAADAGLLEIDSQVRFRHPLVRSAAYRLASRAERRAVHQALADATDQVQDRARRAWHLAAATLGPDEQVAAELEASAARAQERGGLAAAAAFLERSADFTPDPARQTERRLAAAGASLAAGGYERAQALVSSAVPHIHDPLLRARATRMEGEIRFGLGRGGETPTLLFDAAIALAPLDSRLARETLLEALESAMWAEDMTSRATVLDVARTGHQLAPPPGEASTADQLVTGYSECLTHGFRTAVGPWRRAADQALEEMREGTGLQWAGMLWNATGAMLDFERHEAVSRERVRIAREQGALGTLPVALSCLAWVTRLRGRIEVAEALVAEANELAAATGAPSMPGAQGIMHLAMLAWRGRDTQAYAVADDIAREAKRRAQGLAITLANFVLATLELGHGRYDAARDYAKAVFDNDFLYAGSVALPELIEAATRTGDMQLAQAALERLEERAVAGGTDWALGLLARGRALLAENEGPEAHYLASIDHLTRAGLSSERARSHLVYGEWLRRQRRRRDGRAQLRLAHELFQLTGAEAFAERAALELAATGEHARARVPESRDELTPQERQIAQLAADGASNADIAAQLFISPHTVAYHLRKVYGKLGVGSRHQLIGAVR